MEERRRFPSERKLLEITREPAILDQRNHVLPRPGIHQSDSCPYILEGLFQC